MLSAEDRRQLRATIRKLQDLDAAVVEHNLQFVAGEMARCQDFFDSVESHPLTARQREAVIRNEDRNLVVAGAGTGKTATVVARVGYLLNEGLAPPRQILVLAFTRAAKEELEERIRNRFGESVDVRTFHSFGLSILAHAAAQTPSISRMADDENRARAFITKVVQRGLSSREVGPTLIQFFARLLIPRRPTESFESLDDYYRYIKNHEPRTIRGEKVKSLQELDIANWLYCNGVEYVYEAPYEVETADRHVRQYRPDFYLPSHGIYIEHFGVDRFGNPPSRPW